MSTAIVHPGNPSDNRQGLTTRQPAGTTLPEQFGMFSAAEVKASVAKVRELRDSVMEDGVHYGKIPGTPKPTLLQPGAQVLAMTFRLAPRYKLKSIDLPNGHREVQVVCRAESIATGVVYGEGVGCCSTMEKKYRWRTAERSCPQCGQPAIKRSKYPPRNQPNAEPGYYCHDKAGGCGAQYLHDDPRIANQTSGRVENPDVADTYNTVLKMAKKRAFVDCMLSVTAASEIFTQDVEDFDPSDNHNPPAVKPASTPSAASSGSTPHPSAQPTSTANPTPKAGGATRAATPVTTPVENPAPHPWKPGPRRVPSEITTDAAGKKQRRMSKPWTHFTETVDGAMCLPYVPFDRDDNGTHVCDLRTDEIDSSLKFLESYVPQQKENTAPRLKAEAFQAALKIESRRRLGEFQVPSPEPPNPPTFDDLFGE